LWPFLRSSDYPLQWIAGTTKMPHMLDNIGADTVRFTPDEVQELNTALLRTPVHGARLPAMVLSLSGVEAPAKTGVIGH
jgi:hypothetical protein